MKSSQGPVEICDWLLDSSRDHFGLHRGVNVRVVMEFEVLKRRHSSRPALSTDMVPTDEAQEGCLHHGPWSRPKALWNLWSVVGFVPGPLWFTPRRNVRVVMEFEVPKRHDSSRPSLSIYMVQRVLVWERRKWCSSRKKARAHGKAMLLWYSCNAIVSWGEEKMKPKRRQENSHT